MICAIDTETMGLSGGREAYITGCLITERNSDKPEIYDTPEELWKRILELGKSEAKRGKVLNVYAHNHEFDFYKYADIKDRNIKWFSTNPFIVAYTQEYLDTGYKKEIIKFLDTLSIYKMSLKELAPYWKMEKSETPEILKKGTRKPTKKELKKIKLYMIQDTKIVLETIIQLKKKMNEEGITVKRIYTINQIAINHLINTWRKDPNCTDLFWNKESGELQKTWPEKASKIHSSYRGGTVRAFKTGKYENATTIDINNHYSHCASIMIFPDLRTARIKTNPEKSLLQKIGCSRALVYNKNCELGLLPIRTKTNSYYPNIGKYLIGTWTNKELARAEQEGYEIIKLDWTITYETRTNNPFTDYMKTLYEKRNKTNDSHDRYFYKQMMNSCIGKLGQNRTETELVFDSIEKAEEYLSKNYKMVMGIEYDIGYKREQPTKTKKYYCPILPSLITAEARIILYENMKRIDKKDLLYCDTDSITMLNFDKYKKQYKIGLGLGEWKIVHQKVPCEIISRKTYKIADEIKISGIHKYETMKNDWENGIIQNQKMTSIKTQTEKNRPGTFTNEIRDLKEQNKTHNTVQEMLDECVIHIDHDIINISNFTKELASIRDTLTQRESESL